MIKIDDKATLYGEICSPHEVKIIKKFAPKLKCLTPGIRLNKNKNDQKRTMTAQRALLEGSDCLIIGRPITKGDPKKNRITISIEIFILNENGNLIITREFIETFEYNISDNKFDLRQYEKNIKQNLVEDITQQILVFLASV